MSEVFSGAGDIAFCHNPQSAADAEATASLLDTIGGTIFTLGDNAYPLGTPADFECYDRSWGRHKGRTKPSPGNHDYHDYKSPGAETYFRYFGGDAGAGSAADDGHVASNLVGHRCVRAAHDFPAARKAFADRIFQLTHAAFGAFRFSWGRDIPAEASWRDPRSRRLQ